jgi:hypothetical protein
VSRPALIAAAALILRLIAALGQDPLAPYDPARSDDSAWYLANAYALVTGAQPPTMITDVSRLASPPLYFLFIGVPQALLTPEGAVIAVRVAQVLMSALTVAFAFDLARRLSESRRAAALIAWALALHPALIVESGQILTETLFIFLLTAAVWLMLRRPTWSAPVYALAALTRAIALPLPLLLIGALRLLRRATRRELLVFLVIYAAGVGAWTAYSAARWGRWVIAGEGLSAFIYLGAAGWADPQAVDAALTDAGALVDGERDFASAAASAVRADPLGYAARRVSELIGAYLQPHGTTFFPGASLREALANWWRADRTLDGLIALTMRDSFWIKLAVYMVHYTGLILGAFGLARAVRWRERRSAALLIASVIAYFTAAHLVLLALPRYLFPAAVFWWVLASCTFSVSKPRATRPPPPS